MIAMKIAFYGTKPYDRAKFEPMAKDYGFLIHFIAAYVLSLLNPKY